MICHKCQSKNIRYNGRMTPKSEDCVRMCVECRTEYILVGGVWEMWYDEQSPSIRKVKHEQS